MAEWYQVDGELLEIGGAPECGESMHCPVFRNEGDTSTAANRLR